MKSILVFQGHTGESLLPLPGGQRNREDSVNKTAYVDSEDLHVGCRVFPMCKMLVSSENYQKARVLRTSAFLFSVLRIGAQAHLSLQPRTGFWSVSLVARYTVLIYVLGDAMEQRSRNSLWKHTPFVIIPYLHVALPWPVSWVGSLGSCPSTHLSLYSSSILNWSITILEEVNWCLK